MASQRGIGGPARGAIRRSNAPKNSAMSTRVTVAEQALADGRDLAADIGADSV